MSVCSIKYGMDIGVAMGIKYYKSLYFSLSTYIFLMDGWDYKGHILLLRDWKKINLDNLCSWSTISFQAGGLLVRHVIPWVIRTAKSIDDHLDKIV